MSLSLVTPQAGASQAHVAASESLADSFRLTGHAGEVFSCDFSPSGDFLASAGFDRVVMLWDTRDGVHNFGVLHGHSNAILQVKWCHSDHSKVLTASADKSLGWWDVTEGERIKKLRGHTSIVNCCGTNRTGSPVGMSGADDGTVKLWDLRTRRCVSTFEHSYQILSVDCTDSGDRIFAGTLDDSVVILDWRKMEAPIETLSAPSIDSVTGVSVSHDGDSLLTLSMNGTAHLWDIRPFCESDARCLYTYSRITNNFDWNLLRIRWSPDDMLFTVGSSDKIVSVHKVRPDINDMDSLVCALPGHSGTVHESIFHPKERFAILSASSDRNLMYGPVSVQ